VSIGPILAVAGIEDAIRRRTAPGRRRQPAHRRPRVKGPADRMLARLAGGNDPAHVASCYGDLIDVLVVDEADARDVENLAVRPS
jgi:LPPG:FO 2-phospho-L-lactate transferase